MNETMRLQIHVLSRTNVTVHHALTMFERDQCTYEEAMQLAVIQLAAVVESQQKTLIEFATRTPFPHFPAGEK